MSDDHPYANVNPNMMSREEFERYLAYLGKKRSLSAEERTGKDVNGESVTFYGDGYDDARFLGRLRGKADFTGEES